VACVIAAALERIAVGDELEDAEGGVVDEGVDGDGGVGHQSVGNSTIIEADDGVEAYPAGKEVLKAPSTTIVRSSISDPVLRTVDRIGKNVRQLGQATVRTITTIPRHLATTAAAIIARTNPKRKRKRRINILSDDPNALIWLQDVALRPQLQNYKLRRIELTPSHDFNAAVRSVHPNDISLLLCTTDERTVDLVLRATTSRPDVDPSRIVSVVRTELGTLVDGIVGGASRPTSPTVDGGGGGGGGGKAGRYDPVCVAEVHDRLFAYVRRLLAGGCSPGETEGRVRDRLGGIAGGRRSAC